MKTIKLNKEFWQDIIGGKKQYEYRKLEKGYTSGWYKVVDTQTGKELGVMKMQPQYRVYEKDNKYFMESHTETEKFVVENYLGKHDFVRYEILKAHPKCDAKWHTQPEDMIDCCDYCDVILDEQQKSIDEYDAHISTV